MFEKFLSADFRDFNQRYLETFGFFIKDGKRLLSKITSVEPEEVTFVDKDGVAFSLKADAKGDVGFEFLPPKSEWHNTIDGIMLVTRVPAKQYSRGICARNTKIVGPSLQQLPVGFPTLTKIYLEKPTFEQALEKYRETKTKSGLAISGSFALGYGRIFCYDEVIGIAVDEGKLFKITLNDKDMWGQEVSDALVRNKLEGVVV